jgi:hypothetical protein
MPLVVRSGGRPKTWRRSTLVTGRPARPAPHRQQQPGSCRTSRSGRAICANVAPVLPVLPARPPPAALPQRPRCRLGQPLTGRRFRGVPRRLRQPRLKLRDPLQRPRQLCPHLRQLRPHRHHQRSQHLIQRRFPAGGHTRTLLPAKIAYRPRPRPLIGWSSGSRTCRGQGAQGRGPL